MADTSIHGLTDGTTAAATDEAPVIRSPYGSGDDRKLTMAQIATYVRSTITPLAAMVLQSDYTLTNTVASQKLFNVGSGGGGEITVATGTYFVKAMIYITGMSATSGNGTYNVLGAGTATIGNSMRHSVGVDNTTPTTAATQTGAWSLNTATNNMASNATGTAVAVEITGLMDVTAAGTLIPSIVLATAAAAVVKAPSWFTIDYICPSATAYIGDVS